jgi:hypothetical protein
MTHISKRHARTPRPEPIPVVDGLPRVLPLDQPASADVNRDRSLARHLANNPRAAGIARLRKETTATESEADGVLTDHDQVERAEAHAPAGMAPDPNESDNLG